MEKETLKKYLSNNCNNQELEEVISWFKDKAITCEGKKLLYKIWGEIPETDSGATNDFSSVLDKIHHEINSYEAKRLLQQAGDDIVTFNKRRSFTRFIRNAAAILLLPVLGAGLFFSARYYSERSGKMFGDYEYIEVFSSSDAITKVALPDGSGVWLNHSSSLRYPAVFTGRSRNVELFGEGYFEVAHNSKVPFVVNAGGIEVVARGTTFDVMAYPYDNKIETSLISGCVELQELSDNEKVTTLCIMNPNDHTTFFKGDSSIFTESIYDDRYFSWKDGKLVFTDEPMEEVARKLSLWFNADIQIKDPKLKDYTLTATFVHETLPQVMELLAFVSPIKYSISNREKNIDGSFTRRKVIIYER